MSRRYKTSPDRWDLRRDEKIPAHNAGAYNEPGCDMEISFVEAVRLLLTGIRQTKTIRAIRSAFMLKAQLYYGRHERAFFSAMQRVEVPIPDPFNYWEFASMLTAPSRSDAKQLTNVAITLCSRNTKNKEVNIMLRFAVRDSL
jgi:hypothetical protein